MTAATPKPVPVPKTQLEQLAALREPFAPNQIGLLPRAVRKGDTDKMACKPGTQASADGKYCGGYHARSFHLDFVGHAALTDRLLTVDPMWTWEPLAVSPDGLPALDRDGGMWITLTVAGVSRLGYGDAEGKTGPAATKERIGDALRNAGMRFGMALDLWHKGDLHAFAEDQGRTETNAPDALPQEPAPKATPVAEKDWLVEAQMETTLDGAVAVWRKAKGAQAPGPMVAAIVAYCEELRDRDKKLAADVEEAAAAIADPQGAAIDSVKAAFNGTPEGA